MLFRSETTLALEAMVRATVGAVPGLGNPLAEGDEADAADADDDADD